MTNAVMFQPINSLQMATYVIKCCSEKQIPLNITKLQKLMYCCYGTVMARFGRPLMDEKPAAWQYGPVFPTALKALQYFRLSGFKDGNTADADALPESVRSLISETIDYFGRFQASKLSRWSHLPGSPWSKASCDGQFLYLPLSDEDVRKYFATKVFKTDGYSE